MQGQDESWGSGARREIERFTVPCLTASFSELESRSRSLRANRIRRSPSDTSVVPPARDRNQNPPRLLLTDLLGPPPASRPRSPAVECPQHVEALRNREVRTDQIRRRQRAMLRKHLGGPLPTAIPRQRTRFHGVCLKAKFPRKRTMPVRALEQRLMRHLIKLSQIDRQKGRATITEPDSTLDHVKDGFGGQRGHQQGE